MSAKTRTWIVCALALGLPAAAWAGPPAAEGAGEDGSDAVETVTGKQPPPLPSQPQTATLPADKIAALAAQDADKPYPPSTYVGAQTLGLDPQYVFEVQRGVELVYLRDYSGARDHFERLDAAFPGTGVGQVIDVMVWQALMLENFDFKYDKQYWVSSARAREALGKAIATPGGEAWEHLLMCGVAGIESIHTMRQGGYTKALTLAFEAMTHLQSSREAGPDFPDLLLADGMYNYWRTVVTMNSKVLPDFGDHRVEGIEQMRAVETSGVFLAPAATLSLAFTWLEENDLNKALASCMRNRRAYPRNIVNNLMTGTTQLYLKQTQNAIAVFDEVLAEDPENRRVRYWRGYAYLKNGQLDKAESELRTYLGYDYLEPYQSSMAWFRLGHVLQGKKDWAGAANAFEQSWKIDKHKGAKVALDRLNQKKKDGKIQF